MFGGGLIWGGCIIRGAKWSDLRRGGLAGSAARGVLEVLHKRGVEHATPVGARRGQGRSQRHPPPKSLCGG